MAKDTPNPQHLTLRFKKHKTTILLFVSPRDTIDSIKQKLLDTIKATGVSQINGDPLPSKSEDLMFGVLIDKNDPSQGWVGLEIPEVEDDAGKRGNTKNSVLNKTPLGAGLKDGSVLAFKFRGVESSGDGMDIDDGHWDVIMPSFDDEDGAQ
ncbi:MAG: hypothetical protein Q9201_004751 [Fulgogasparrea decipioides]